MYTITRFVGLLFSSFVFIAYLMILFQIVVDLFRDPDVSGWSRAFWIIGLVFLPFITALLYVIARGRGMAARQRAALQRGRAEAGASSLTSAAEQISRAKSLLDAGTINRDEFLVLKGKALA